jgi:hypothetical protein
MLLQLQLTEALQGLPVALGHWIQGACWGAAPAGGGSYQLPLFNGKNHTKLDNLLVPLLLLRCCCTFLLPRRFTLPPSQLPFVVVVMVLVLDT